MKWQCALLQRWLPEYPDGDLPGWGKRWLQGHVAHCPACRQELAGLREVVTAIQAAPVGDREPEFWRDFSREMHLKLAQAAYESQSVAVPPTRLWLRLPYLLGAPVLAGLLLWVAVQLTGPSGQVPNQAMVKNETPTKMAAVPKLAPTQPTAVVAPPVEQFVPVTLEEGGALPPEDADISGWDLDSELAGMTDQEKETFLKKMHQHDKDGSCLEKYSLCSWA